MRPDSFRPPVTLGGRHVVLIPLDRSLAPALHVASRDPEIARYLFSPPGPTIRDTERYLRELLDRQAAGTDLPFAILNSQDGALVGATRYLHIDREFDSVEIGGTWLDTAVWRTAVNTEAKYLLLRHAFDVEGAHRVALVTDLRNERSQVAIERLGATREGILREDRPLPGGGYRSTVVYSVLRDEWPRVRARLERFLLPAGPPPPERRGAPSA